MSSAARRRRLPWFLALRYLRGRRSRLLSGTSRAALGSCALGVAAMVVATALMNGYTETLVDKMMQAGAILAVPTAPPEQARNPEADLRRIGGVEWVLPAVQGQGSLTSGPRPEGTEVFLRGILPGTGPLRASAQQIGPRAGGARGVVLGRGLADRLGVTLGDRIDLVALDFTGLGRSTAFRFRTLEVTGTFETGFSVFDLEYALLDLDFVRDLTGAPLFYEVGIDEAEHLVRIEAEAQAALGEEFLIRNWQVYNPELFTALRLQKWVLFFLLGLIVVVSTFSVVSTLVVLVRERTRELGVMAAIGARPGMLRAVFLRCGLLLGGAGTAIGLTVGVGLCWLLTVFEVLDFDDGMAEIYFIDRVPFVVRWTDLLAVVVFSLSVSVLASRIPARRAARLRPADALRYE